MMMCAYRDVSQGRVVRCSSRQRQHRQTTVPVHMPSIHRRSGDWTTCHRSIGVLVTGPSPAPAAVDHPAIAGPLRADPGAPAASGTRALRLPRHCAPGAAIRRRSPRSGRHARIQDRHRGQSDTRPAGQLGVLAGSRLCRARASDETAALTHADWLGPSALCSRR
jgi:hypothetical protein